MKKASAILLTLFLTFFLAGASIAQSQDTIKVKKHWLQTKLVKTTMPAFVLVGGGLALFEDTDDISDDDYDGPRKHRIIKSNPSLSCHVDDYLQFAPAASV